MGKRAGWTTTSANMCILMNETRVSSASRHYSNSVSQRMAGHAQSCAPAKRARERRLLNKG